MPTLKEIIAMAAAELDARRANFADRTAARKEAIEAIRALESVVFAWFKEPGKLLANLPLLSSEKYRITGVRLDGVMGRKLPCFATTLDDPRVLLHDGRGAFATVDDIERLEPRLSRDWTIEVQQDTGHLMLCRLEAAAPGDDRQKRSMGAISRDVIDQLDDELADSWEGLVLGKKGVLNWLTVKARGEAHRRKYEYKFRPAEDDDLQIRDLWYYLRALDYAWEQEEYKAEATERQRRLAENVQDLVAANRRDD